MYNTKFVLLDGYELSVRKSSGENVLIGQVSTKDDQGRIVWGVCPEYNNRNEDSFWGFIDEMYAAVFCAQVALKEKEITEDDFEELNDSRNEIIREVSED